MVVEGRGYLGNTNTESAEGAGADMVKGQSLQAAATCSCGALTGLGRGGGRVFWVVRIEGVFGAG